MKFTYLLVDFCTLIVPLIFSFHPRLRFDKFFKEYFLANFISAFIFLVWDAIFTANGVWGFSDRYTLGFRLFKMPIEEVLFFFCIPFACLFTYHCFTKFFTIRWTPSFERNFFSIFCFLLFVIGIYFNNKAYTSVTFISSAFLIFIFLIIFRVKWLGPFFTIYPVLLIPFFIVNGILTGTGLQEPVVWYNNNENLGIRMGTIPVEDIIYGLELLILTLFFYELFKSKKKTIE